MKLGCRPQLTAVPAGLVWQQVSDSTVDVVLAQTAAHRRQFHRTSSKTSQPALGISGRVAAPFRKDVLGEHPKRCELFGPHERAFPIVSKPAPGARSHCHSGAVTATTGTALPDQTASPGHRLGARLLDDISRSG